MKRIIQITVAIISGLVASTSCCNNSGYGYEIKDGVAIYNTPDRPADQISMIGFAADPLETVRIGVIGLGMRGPDAVNRFANMDGTEILAICDLYPEKLEGTQQILERNGRARAAEYSGPEGWKKLCDREDLDLVYIVTPWDSHTPMAVYAMEQGKHVAIEVPAATSVDECWQLVNTAEKTRRHCMMLENCVYDFFEMSTLAMAQEGVFGEVIHVEGAYHHCLDPYWNEYWESWRLEFNKENRGDVYPTHGIGPVCQVLNIHRGDRMKTLVSMDTKPLNGPKIYQLKNGTPCPEFQNGDQTSTLIRTENGKTMLIQHDVMTPRPYDRLYQVVGTDGYAGKYPVQLYCLRENASLEEGYDALGTEKLYSGNALKELQAKYPNALMNPEFVEFAQSVGGHGGMDFIMDYRLIYCLHKGLPLDMDVYDMAEWCCVSELSRISLENGSMPVEVPDFTRGQWNKVNGFTYAF